MSGHWTPEPPPAGLLARGLRRRRRLRSEQERRRVDYVLAVARDHWAATPAGRLRADALTAELPRRAWQPVSAGAGAKGDRVYDWAFVPIDTSADQPGHRSGLDQPRPTRQNAGKVPDGERLLA
jgi:hypothetical protein